MSKDNAKNMCAYITLSSSLTSVVSDGTCKNTVART